LADFITIIAESNFRCRQRAGRADRQRVRQYRHSQHGGQETTITSFHSTLLHQGMIIVGLPYAFPGVRPAMQFALGFRRKRSGDQK
jgi:hypothetical protein